MGSFKFGDAVVVVDATAIGGERTERNLPAVSLSNLGGANAPCPYAWKRVPFQYTSTLGVEPPRKSSAHA